MKQKLAQKTKVQKVQIAPIEAREPEMEQIEMIELRTSLPTSQFQRTKNSSKLCEDMQITTRNERPDFTEEIINTERQLINDGVKFDNGNEENVPQPNIRVETDTTDGAKMIEDDESKVKMNFFKLLPQACNNRA